ncbi:MAG TPA: carboxypeptidase regulatory-like domain-containing protein [Bryobacteraceae bacterium]|jgi:hypothetical protein
MRLLAVAAAVPLFAFAQGVVGVGVPQRAPGTAAPPAAKTELKPEDLCTVEGKVFSAATGEPLHKATLTLTLAEPAQNASGPPASYTTSSGPDGAFAMKDIDPARYRLMVSRTGFVNMQYGARSPQRPGTLLTLARGQHLKDIVFRLPPHGVVTGRVVDEDGDPVMYAQVQLMRTSYMQGRKQLTYAGAASTNDLGEYRIFSVAPGKYFLSATYRAQNMYNALDRSAAPSADEDYVPIFYPGTTEPASAAQIDVAAGGQLTNMNLKLTKARTVRIRGKVSQSVATGRTNIQAMLVPRNTDMMLMLQMNRARPVDPKGNFEITGVAPGSYFVQANLFTGERNYSARAPVEVGSSNIDGLELAIGQGVTLPGTVRVEGDAPQPLNDLQLQFLPAQMGGPIFSSGRGKVNADGSFNIENLSPDKYRLMVIGLPEGSYIKSVRMGQTEMQPGAVEITGAPEPMVIVLSLKAGQVSGTVQNPSTQQPAPGATVVLVPQEKERRDQNLDYKQTATDQFGNFAFKNLTPGEYKAFAWEDIEPGAYYDPEFLKPVDGNGEKITVEESGKQAVQLKLIPAETPAQR